MGLKGGVFDVNKKSKKQSKRTFHYGYGENHPKQSSRPQDRQSDQL